MELMTKQFDRILEKSTYEEFLRLKDFYLGLGVSQSEINLALGDEK